MFMAAVIGVIVVVLFIMSTWQRHLDRDEKQDMLGKIEDAVARGSHKPIAQYPQINPYTCIGCGSCIEACPEDEVIGLVNGIAHVVHASRCVGHAHCEFACPVNAIKVGLGNVALRPDIPILSEELETSIPGVYIAGELGGISLIRNAIAQGGQVIDTIARKLQKQGPSRTPGVVDVVIVGAGPAGLAASLKAIEQKLSYVTISQEEVGGAVRKYPRRKLTLVQAVNIPLYGKMKSGEYEKETLVDLWNEITRTYQVKIQAGTSLKDVKRQGQALAVTTNTGILLARSVVLAVGRRGTPRKLGVPGEESAKVLYELIDAATYNRQRVLIVGGGDSAVEAAIGLANQTGNTVTMSYRQANFFRLKSRNEARIKEYVAKRRIAVHFASEVSSIESDAVILTINQQGSKRSARLPNDYVLIFAGGEPPYPLLKQIGIRFGGNAAQVAA